ncbi:MAG: 4-alpha-glucanotransferase [Candidatus Eremiobacteraeota bacterium]|nr:4-alpha-glucanotransferase [Candidatus Eremiobacteraeota bacterium]
MTPLTTNPEKLEEKFRKYPTYKAWKQVGLKPRFGILMPLAQMRTKRNSGVGDFADLQAFGEFCKSIGCTILQLLPINDMGRGKTPYSSLSAFALDPIYIALDNVSELKKGQRSEEMEKYLESNKEKIYSLKAKKRIDYDNIRKYKLDALQIAYNDFIKAEKEAGLERWQDFEKFRKDNEYWLPDYALFRALKEKYMWDPWEKWPGGTRTRSKRRLPALLKEHAGEIDFYSFVQWIAFDQMKSAQKALLEMGIYLKGDLPLLVDVESADVWGHPEYFNTEVCAGAPPDQYSLMGQNWGMPTYNWEKLAEDNNTWWRKRLQYAENFYHIYRIDHVVGIFRIWTIPITQEFPRGKKSGEQGYFDPADKGLKENKKIWEEHGSTILNMLVESSNMLPIGEDLGTIPLVCRKTLSDMGIPGYKVLIWERDWTNREKEFPFIPPEEYPYLSMSTSTTHDFWTLAGWWIHRPGTVSENGDIAPEIEKMKAKDEEELKNALYKFLVGEGEKPKAFTEKLYKAVMHKLFHSGSIFLIMPFQDLWGVAYGLYGEDPEGERINDPDKPHLPENWTGKMPLEIESLHLHPSMTDKIDFVRRLAGESGRI